MEKNFADLSAYFNEQLKRSAEMITESDEEPEHQSKKRNNSLPNGKKTKGRVKIKMEFIDNKLRRYTTFSKRKTGIMKKAYELSTLTGTQVMLLVASETGHVYTFATKKLQPMITSEAGKALIQTCLNSPDEPDFEGSGDQRMCATGYEETDLNYGATDEMENEEEEEQEAADDEDEATEGAKDQDEVSDENSNDVKPPIYQMIACSLPQPAHRPLNSDPLDCRPSVAAATGADALMTTSSHLSAAFPYFLALSSAAATARSSGPPAYVPPVSCESVGHSCSSVRPAPVLADPTNGPVLSASGRYSSGGEVGRRPELRAGSSQVLYTLAARGNQEELVRIARLLPREPLPLQMARRIAAASNDVEDESSNASNSPENLSLRKQ